MKAGTTSYRYTQRNLLAERYHYMYTPYEGPDFLRAFVEQRTALLAKLSAARETFLAEPSTEVAISEEIRHVVLGKSADVGSRPLLDRQYEVLPAQPGQGDFDTQSVLLDLFQCLAYDGQRNVRECPSWVAFFHTRFEVTKRLNVRYTAALKPATQVNRRPSSYALLAALLMYNYRQTGDLRCLNTVLKLVDLLDSIGLAAQDPLTQLTTSVALEGERDAIQDLLRDQRIEL